MKISSFIKAGAYPIKSTFNKFVKDPTLLFALGPFLAAGFMLQQVGVVDDVVYNLKPTVDLSYRVNVDNNNPKYTEFKEGLLLDKAALLDAGFNRGDLAVKVALDSPGQEKKAEFYNSNGFLQLYMRDYETSEQKYDVRLKGSLQLGLFKIFKSNEKVLSYIFFHEFGHRIDLENEYTNKLIVSLVSEEDNNNISNLKDTIGQLEESFADAFAIKMMISRYPELEFNETKKLIAGLRHNESFFATNGYDIGYGLLVDNIYNTGNQREDVLKYSLGTAMENYKFHYFSHKLGNLDLQKLNEEEKVELGIVLSKLGTIREWRDDYLSFAKEKDSAKLKIR